jgi:hypothetical protein
MKWPTAARVATIRTTSEPSEPPVSASFQHSCPIPGVRQVPGDCGPGRRPADVVVDGAAVPPEELEGSCLGFLRSVGDLRGVDWVCWMRRWTRGESQILGWDRFRPGLFFGNVLRECRIPETGGPSSGGCLTDDCQEGFRSPWRTPRCEQLAVKSPAKPGTAKPSTSKPGTAQRSQSQVQRSQGTAGSCRRLTHLSKTD